MTVDIICADAREALARFPDGHFHCCVTSPPFWGLRDYGLEPMVWGPEGCEHEWGEESSRRYQEQQATYGGQCGPKATAPTRPRTMRESVISEIKDVRTGAFCRRCNAWRGTLGLEPTPELYVEHLVAVMREVRRVLRDDGVLWLNIGDSYNAAGRDGHGTRIGYKQGTNRASATGADGNRPTAPSLKPKDLVGVPWRVAFALQADGWWLRQENIWYKKNPMPESADDRTTRAHESVFQLTKRGCYAYDADAIRELSQSGPSDIKKMLESRERIGGIHKIATDPLLKASALTNIGQKRAVGSPAGRNRRSVWEIATQPFGLEMCGACRTIYSPAQYRRLRGGSMPRCNHEVIEDEPCGGTKWLAQDGGAMCASCETFYTAKQLERLPRAAQCRRCGSEEWLSHFAVFPEKLVEPCILAGTSERGCCPKCGAPWERVVKQEFVKLADRRSTRKALQQGADMADINSHDAMGYNKTETVGWRPTCEHGAEPVPCRVLDPFAGSGTVGVVAERLGRHSVLIDAKEEYCEMARHRTAQRGLMVEAAL